MTWIHPRLLPAKVLLLALVVPAFLEAQVLPAASVAYPILAQGPWARPAGMGNCSIGLADDLSALHSDPAGLDLLQGMETALAHSGGIGGGFTETLGLALRMGGVGTLGFSGSLTDYGSIERRDSSGVLLGTYHPMDVGLRAAFGFSPGPDLHLGIGTHWIRQDLDGSVEAGLAWDAGLLMTPGEILRFGATLRNLGLETGGEALALELALGGSIRLDFGKEEDQCLLLAVEGGYGAQEIGRIGVGGEYSFRKEYFLRVGFARDLVEDLQDGIKGLSLGAGIRLGQAKLDYSFSFQGELGNLHRLSLALAFPEEGKGKGSSDLSKVPPGNSLPPGTVTLPGPSATPLPGTEDKRPVLMKFQLSFEGDLTAQQLLAKGEEKWRLGLQQEALDCFLKAVEKDPDLDRAWELLGRAYLERSLESYRKLLERHPENDRLRRWLDSHQRK